MSARAHPETMKMAQAVGRPGTALLQKATSDGGTVPFSA
jgi:hypothetical protein